MKDQGGQDEGRGKIGGWWIVDGGWWIEKSDEWKVKKCHGELIEHDKMCRERSRPFAVGCQGKNRGAGHKKKDIFLLTCRGVFSMNNSIDWGRLSKAFLYSGGTEYAQFYLS